MERLKIHAKDKIKADIPVLMAKYFCNRIEIKAIRCERVEYLEQNKCNRGDCISLGLDDWCDVCKKRHGYYLALKKLVNENRGIMLKVRFWSLRLAENSWANVV